MADNTAQNGTNTVATDDIGGVHYQRVKNGFGADGSYTDVSLTAGMPTQRVELNRATYSATINNTAVAGVVTLAVPVWEIQNPTANTTKLLRITRIEYQAVAATAGLANVMLVRRAVSTGGTAVVQAAANGHDTTNAAASAVVNYYTAAPTAGTLNAIVRHQRIWAHATTMTATIVPPVYVWEFDRNQGVVLRPGQALSIQSSTAWTGVPTLAGSVEWTEELI
jgi:hypothetical protein